MGESRSSLQFESFLECYHEDNAQDHRERVQFTKQEVLANHIEELYRELSIAEPVEHAEGEQRQCWQGETRPKRTGDSD